GVPAGLTPKRRIGHHLRMERLVGLALDDGFTPRLLDVTLAQRPPRQVDRLYRMSKRNVEFDVVAQNGEVFFDTVCNLSSDLLPPVFPEEVEHALVRCFADDVVRRLIAGRRTLAQHEHIVSQATLDLLTDVVPKIGTHLVL